MKKLSKGYFAETLAKYYLHCYGWACIDRNFLSKMGEIDLIMMKKKQIIIVEVRFRKQNIYGTAEASIDHKKQKNIRKTAHYFLSRFPQYQDHAIRFDAIVFNKKITIKNLLWIQNAY
jgi:putative endonuclease